MRRACVLGADVIIITVSRAPQALATIADVVLSAAISVITFTDCGLELTPEGRVADIDCANIAIVTVDGYRGRGAISVHASIPEGAEVTILTRALLRLV